MERPSSWLSCRWDSALHTENANLISYHALCRLGRAGMTGTCMRAGTDGYGWRPHSCEGRRQQSNTLKSMREAECIIMQLTSPCTLLSSPGQPTSCEKSHIYPNQQKLHRKWQYMKWKTCSLPAGDSPSSPSKFARNRIFIEGTDAIAHRPL